MKPKGAVILVLAIFGLLCADILVLDKDLTLYRNSLLTQTAATLPGGAEDSIIPIHSEAKRAYAVEFKDSLFLDSVVGYVRADYAENQDRLHLYDITIKEINMRFSPRLRKEYRVPRKVYIVINKWVYVALVKRGTVDTSYIKFNTYKKLKAIYKLADSLRHVARTLQPKDRSIKFLKMLAAVKSVKFSFKGIRISVTKKQAVNNPVWSYLSVERKDHFQNVIKKKYYKAKYYVHGRDVLYWIQKSDGLRTYRGLEEYRAHVQAIESRKQYVKKHQVTGLKAQAILSGKIVQDMTETDVVASISGPARKTRKAERFGTVQQIWFYPKYKLHFLDGKLLKWE